MTKQLHTLAQQRGHALGGLRVLGEKNYHFVQSYCSW